VEAAALPGFRPSLGPATQTQATGCKNRGNQEKRRWFRYPGLVPRDNQCHSSEIVGYDAIGDDEIQRGA
jgi:hypothetical protein